MKRAIVVAVAIGGSYFFLSARRAIPRDVLPAQLTLIQESHPNAKQARELVLGEADDGGLVAGNYPDAVTSATMPNQVSTGTSPDLINEGVSPNLHSRFSETLAGGVPLPKVLLTSNR